LLLFCCFLYRLEGFIQLTNTITDVITNYTSHFEYNTVQSTKTTGKDISTFVSTTAIPNLTKIGTRPVDTEFTRDETRKALEEQGIYYIGTAGPQH
jgi:hypothetical protein